MFRPQRQEQEKAAAALEVQKQEAQLKQLSSGLCPSVTLIHYDVCGTFFLLNCA